MLSEKIKIQNNDQIPFDKFLIYFRDNTDYKIFQDLLYVIFNKNWITNKPIATSFYPLYLSISLISDSLRLATYFRKDELIDYYYSENCKIKPHIFYMVEPESIINLFGEIRKYISEEILIKYLGLE